MEAPSDSGAGTRSDGNRSEDEDIPVETEFFTFPEVPDPVVTLQEDPLLQRNTWVERDATDWQYYIPSFTRPGYEDDVEVSADGVKQRPRARGGDFWNLMRPALAPTDPAATEYARRFGMLPDRKYNERAEARSMLTPVPTSNESDTHWSFEQSFQSAIFQSFTTKELSDLGALDPTQALPHPDLGGDLFHLVARNRWSKLENDQTDIRNRFWYNLNGQKKSWAVEENDELWTALQPTLQLVSRVLQSGHPFWKAMLNLYHLRPVPEEKDGRTDEEKAKPGYKPYTSVWYDIDESKMYPSAKLLMDERFDSEAAALEMLRILLRFSIIHVAGSTNAVTRPIDGDQFTPERCKIRIELNAAVIWPLLAPQYSVSEKTSVSFFLAKLILHELAHAARLAQVFLLSRTEFLMSALRDEPWTPPPNTNFNWNINSYLKGLLQEANFDTLNEHVSCFVPPAQDKYLNRSRPGQAHSAELQFCPDGHFIATKLKTDIFNHRFQDVPQVEEGKCFEQQLWGFDISLGPEPPLGRQNEAFRPVLNAMTWPWAHPKIHLQNRESINAGLYHEFTSRGYKTYLVDPPASAYNLLTPLPVSSFAKFMQQSWWDTDFVKFGHQGLKLPIHSTDPNSPYKTIARPNENLRQFLPMLTMVIRSQIALDFIDYAINSLYEHSQTAILTYLVLLTREAASASILRNRLHYEKRTWPNRLRGIDELSQQSTQNFRTVWNSVNQDMLGHPSQSTLDNLQQVTRDIRELLVNLSELNRLLGVEIQYSQGIAAQYILKTPEERRKIHRRYVIFLRHHLLRITDIITDTLSQIANEHEGDDQLEWETVFAPWEAQFAYMVATYPGTLDRAMQQQIQDATDAFADLRTEVQQQCVTLAMATGHVDSIVRTLGDEWIDYPIAGSPRGPFPGVPIARSMMELSKSVETAAIQQIVGLAGHKSIDDIVRQWMRLLRAHLGLSDRIRGVQEQVMVTRGKADLMAIKTILFQAKRDENQPAGAVEAGEVAKNQQLARLRAQIRNTVRNNQDFITYLREICGEEGDDDEFQTIMRIPYPVPQQPNV